MSKHHDLKEAIQEALANAATYREKPLCNPQLTRKEDWSTGGTRITGLTIDAECPPSDYVKALIDADLDGATSAPAPPPPDDEPTAGTPAPPASDPPVPPPAPPPAEGEGEHTWLARITQRKTGKIWQAQVKVGDDPSTPAVFAPFQDSDGNDHPALDWFGYADCAEVRNGGLQSTADYINCDLYVEFDGTEIPIRATNTDGSFDFWRFCSHQTIRAPINQTPLDPDFDKSCFPNYAQSDTLTADDGTFAYTFNGLGATRLPGMGSAGDRGEIAPVQKLDVPMIVNPNANNYAVARRVADNSGNWGLVVYDRKTGLPVDIAVHGSTSLLSIYNGADWNSVAKYVGSYDGDTLTKRVGTTGCPNTPNIAHLTENSVVMAAATDSARDKDHAGFWANYVIIGENPSYWHERGAIDDRPQRWSAWGLRSIFYGAFLSSTPEYFRAELDRNLKLLQAFPHNAYGIFDNYQRSDATKGYIGSAEWMGHYFRMTINQIANKVPEWQPEAAWLGKLPVMQVLDDDGNVRPQAPLSTLYVWSYKDAATDQFLSMPDQYRASMSKDWSQADIDKAMGSPTAEEMRDLIAKQEPNSTWAGLAKDGVCDFMQDPWQPGHYPDLFRAAVVAAVDAGTPNADKALAYCDSVPTLPQWDKNADYRYRIVPRPMQATA